MNKTMLIRYIGRQINRPDDVLRTDRLWSGFGATVEVPADEAAHYLRHPMEFEAATHDEEVQRQQAAALTAESFQRIREEWEPLTITDLQALVDLLNERIALLRLRIEENAANKPIPPLPVPDAAEKAASDDAASAKAAHERLAKIASAIAEMDPQNPDHFSERTGRPLIAAVAEQFGGRVTAKEIDAALPLVNDKAK